MIDFTQSRNVSIAISFSGLAVGAISGIVLNAVLPDNEYLGRNYT